MVAFSLRVENSRAVGGALPCREFVRAEAGLKDELSDSRLCQSSGLQNSRIRVEHSVHILRPSSHPCTRASSVSGPVVNIACGSAAPAVSGLVVSSAVCALSYAEAAPVACKCGNGLHACTSNSGGLGGLLPVQKSTSCNLDVCSQSPTGTRRVKGGVCGPTKDSRPVSEVEAGVNFGVGAGCGAVSSAATRTRFQDVCCVCGDTFGPPGGSWYPVRVTLGAN